MIAKNFIQHPEALRFQAELFHNGYHNSPRIMRLMEVICRIAPTVPRWVKEAAAATKRLVKMWKGQQITLNFKAAKQAPTEEEKLKSFLEFPSMRWTPNFQHDEPEYCDYTPPNLGRYMSYCQRHQGGWQGWAGSVHKKNRYNA